MCEAVNNERLFHSLLQEEKTQSVATVMTQFFWSILVRLHSPESEAAKWNCQNI